MIRALEILASVGMAEKANESVKNLSHGEQRQIEITLVLVTNPKLVLLDEPTAGLSPAESAVMTAIIQKLDPAITVLIIEHNMDVAYQVADQITVLHQGCVFVEGTQKEPYPPGHFIRSWQRRGDWYPGPKWYGKNDTYPIPYWLHASKTWSSHLQE